MKILLVCSPADEDFLDKLQKIPALHGHRLVKTTTVHVNPVTLDSVCDKHGIDSVYCIQQETFLPILKDTPGFIAPPPPKKLTLNDYAGSVLKLRSGRWVVVGNPLERLFTVAYERFIVDRYISKLTKPHIWWPQTKFEWKLVEASNEAEALQDISTSLVVAIDIECPWPQDELRTIKMVSYTTYHRATHKSISWVVPFDELWHWDFIRKANATKTRKVFQNGLFDNTYFMRWGCPVRNWVYDTFHLFHCWQAELPKRLDFITAFLVRDIRYWKEDGSTGNTVDEYRYCGLDGWATINSLFALMQLMPDWAVFNYTEHEFPTVFPCLTVALEGFDCDQERFKKIAAEKEANLAALLKRIQFLVNDSTYNPGSWQQNERLFAILGCSDIEGTGKIPTQKAKFRHPLNNLVLTLVEDYKKEAKQVGTYFDITKLWHGRIYYTINPGATDTGRGGSSESAFDCGWQIQNIPATDDSFKQCVIAPPGWFIAEPDKAQSEARCVGYLSGEQALINLVESDKDYHSFNAAAFFGMVYEAIWDVVKKKAKNKKIRDLSKRTNHGANYNMGALVMLDTMGPKMVSEAKIVLKLSISFSLRMVCQYLLERYESTYPAVKGRWYESIKQAIESVHRLVSPLGWTRYFHGSPRNNKLHLNSAVAHPPQNLSVSIVNIEWRAVWRETIYGSLRGRVRIKAQIHDSLPFIYRELGDARVVESMMQTSIKVVGSDGVTRDMKIPTELSVGEDENGNYSPKTRWSEIK